MSDQQTPTTEATDAEFHIRRVEREVNAQLAGEATVRSLVRLMLEMGWTPPRKVSKA